MTNEEFIALLRDVYVDNTIRLTAADRIEQLQYNLKTSEEIGRAFEEDAGQLRAKLDKATDALKELIFLSNEGDIVDWLNALARAQELMAEIKGE
jgi:hypothetical protein